MYEIVVQEDADDEIKAAAVFYESRQAGLGNLFLQEVEAGFSKIASFPLSWTILIGDIRSCLMRRFPHAIVYRLEDERILVIAVTHQRRKPFYWRERLK
jgi:plasmid stabilization system protein ParE